MTAQAWYAALRPEPLSLDAALAGVAAPDCGGVALFVGMVRDHDHGAQVTSLDYSAHPGAEAELQRCAQRVGARHGVRVWVAHRTGSLAVGDLAVVVAAAAAHRAPALAACRELIEELKRDVPIWKQQQLRDGEHEWVGL